MNIDQELATAIRKSAHIMRHNCVYGQSQNRILSLLRRNGPMTQKQLLQEMRIQAGSLSELVSKVENAGYINKTRSAEDKRVCTLTITEAGIKRAEEFGDEQRILTEHLLSPLTEEQKLSILENLNLLIDKCEPK